MREVKGNFLFFSPAKSKNYAIVSELLSVGKHEEEVFKSKKRDESEKMCDDIQFSCSQWD